MDLKILESIGLTIGESKVYLSLLQLGETKTGPLAVKAGVSSSKVYKILDRLEKKGLAGHIIKAKTKYFKAMEARRILDYLDEKEKDLQEKKEQVKTILPELDATRMISSEKNNATVYQGFKAIMNFYRNILDELKAGETYHVLGAYYGENAVGVRAFFQNYHTLRVKKKIKVHMLANFETKNTLVLATKKYSQIRFLPHYLVPSMTVVFYHKKAFIFFLTKEPTGFLMQSEEVVKSFKAYFETLWKIAK